MQRDHIKQFLKALGVHQITDRDTWVACPCPQAAWNHDSGKDSHPSFGIKVVDNGESHFHCWACESGSLTDLVYDIRDNGGFGDFGTAMKFVNAELNGDLVLSIPDYEELGKQPDVIFTEMWWESFPEALKCPDGYTYLKGRGLPDTLIHELGIRYDTSRRAVVFPIRNRQGQLAQVRGRYINPQGDGPRYHVYSAGSGDFTRKIWYGEEWYDPDDMVVMVESVFDLASVYRIYKNVIAPLSVGITEGLCYRVSECWRIVTLFDNGKGGDKARKLVDKHFPDAIVTHLHPPDGVSDPGDMTIDDLHDRLDEFLPKGG